MTEAESSRSLLILTVKSGSWTKVAGKMPFTTICASSETPSAEMLLKFGTSFSSAMVIEPPSRTASFATMFGWVIGSGVVAALLPPPLPPQADRT